MTDDEIDAHILSQLSRTAYTRSEDIALAPGMTLEQKRASLNRMRKKHKVRRGHGSPPHRARGWRRIA